jgi:hypothetical protein
MDPDAVPFLKLKGGRPRKQKPPESFFKPERQTLSREKEEVERSGGRDDKSGKSPLWTRISQPLPTLL